MVQLILISVFAANKIRELFVGQFFTETSVHMVGALF